MRVERAERSYLCFPEGKHEAGVRRQELALTTQPEGNLFKDRFQSLQRRALIEPRVPQLPKKRMTKVKEYEKFAWKRFE